MSLNLAFARNAPVKIWLDGEEIFADANGRDFVYDGEKIRMELTKGRHELRIKISPYSPNTRRYPEFVCVDVSTGWDYYNRSEGICPRFIDDEGNLIETRLATPPPVPSVLAKAKSLPHRPAERGGLLLRSTSRWLGDESVPRPGIALAERV